MVFNIQSHDLNIAVHRYVDLLGNRNLGLTSHIGGKSAQLAGCTLYH